MSTKELWHTYVQLSQINQELLPNHIVESWEYCMNHDVNPFSRQGVEKVSGSALRTQKKTWAYLINIVKDEIRRLNEFFYIKKPLFILTDKNGVVLWRDGHEETRHLANEIRFSEGSIWTEKAVGTNAIGISLRTLQSVTVERFEHFAEASHPFTCSSTPILDGNNQVVACLNVSTMEELVESGYTLFALKMIAKNVQQKMAEVQLAEQKEAFLEALNLPFEQSILVGLDGKVLSVSDDVKELLVGSEGKTITELATFNKNRYTKHNLYQQEELIGFCYQLETKKLEPSFISFGITSQNERYQVFLNQLSQAAKSDLPIHIYGETGSGKEVSAKTIHFNSSRQSGKLVAVNCGALSENLLESELFGYAPGAFTGAKLSGYKGKIEQADNGTLFLDEIDSMSKRMQVALLRTLEDKKITPIGSDQEISVNFRLVTASNKNLKELVNQGKFREDLFYRLYVVPLKLPPLRKRQEDFEVLVETFCDKKNWHLIWKNKISDLSKEFEWEGNIREFHNFLERLYLYFPTKEPTRDELIELIAIGSIKINRMEETYLDERVEIINALESTNYHLSQTAEKLNMARSTLYRKIDKYQIEIIRR